MHLHHMTIAALGPFAGAHRIDFGELGASGIFLLEGPTGAGKSTIIDAIVFALYGKVASDAASEDRLRSDHADPTVETVVDLVLETGSGVYRVRRTPRFERPKRNGRGTTTQQATVKLWRLARPDAPDHGELMSTRLDEAGAELQRIVGLDRSQFVQTIVLPQGEFAAFLRSKPEDRRGLLQKVFGTGVYEAVQQRLAVMRAEAGRALEERRQGVELAASHFIGATELAEAEAQAVREVAGLVGDTLLGLVRGHVTAADETAAEEARSAHAAKAVSAQAQQVLTTLRAREAGLRRRARLRAELGTLRAQAGEHAAWCAEQEVAGRAGAALSSVHGAEVAARAVVATRARVSELRAAAPEDVQELVDELTEPGVQRKTLVVERDRCTALRGSLAGLLELERGLPGRRAAISGLRNERAAAAQDREGLALLRGRRPAERQLLRERLDLLTRVAGGLAAAQQLADAARARCVAAEGVEAMAADLADADRTMAVAVRHASQTVDRAAALQQARIAGIAGELALGLTPGTPCTVCGGTDHPRPAARHPAHVTVEDVRAAEDERVAAERALSLASSAVTTLRERIAGQVAATGGLDAGAARGQLDAALAAVVEAEQAALRRRELSGELEGHDALSREMDERLASLATQLAAMDARLIVLLDGVEQDEARVAAALDGAASVRERVAELERRSALVSDWVEALGNLEDAVAQAAAREAEQAAALLEHRFEHPGEVRAAHRTRTELEALDRRIGGHRAALARVEGALADPELAALGEGSAPDVPAAEREHERRDAEATAAAARAARAHARADAGRRALHEVDRALAAHAEAVQDAGPIVRMADVATANGSDNALQLTLATFVLTRRFEDVVAAANLRLVTMSGGRYALARSGEREDVHSRRTGLAMKVVDHTTGVERDPRTLSGGETFYVSLCLALGLADVVTAEAGGIDLGTLFVDEGFGTLDPETLDVVLAELGRLREGGRVVGVVSHVEALKQSVAERIEVRRLPDGSSTLTVRA